MVTLLGTAKKMSNNLIPSKKKKSHLLGLIHDRPQTQWTGQNDIRVVELRKVLDRLAGELESQSEHIVVITAEQLAKVLSFVLPRRVFRRRERIEEALLVLLLLRLVKPSDGVDHTHACLSSWENIQNLRTGESLVTALNVGVGVLGQACVVLEHLVPGLDEVVDSVKGHDVAHGPG